MEGVETICAGLFSCVCVCVPRTGQRTLTSRCTDTGPFTVTSPTASDVIECDPNVTTTLPPARGGAQRGPGPAREGS